MTTRTLCVLNANALGPGLVLDPGGLRVSAGIICDGKRMVLGNLAQRSGESTFELYFWSTLRNSLAGLASYGIAQPDVDLANFVGGDAAGKSWGFRPGDGQVWNANANASGTSVEKVDERVCLGLRVRLSPSTCTCEWLVAGTVVYTATLPNGKAWVPAISMGSTAPGDVSAIINCGQYRTDQNVATRGWWQQAPGLEAMYLSLATEAFMSAATDADPNRHYAPLVLNEKQISIKRLPQAWFHRSGGSSSNPAAISTLRLDNSKGFFNPLVGADVRDSPVTLQVIPSPAGGSGSIAAAVPMLTGILDSTSQPDVSTVTAGLRDPLARFDKPCPVRMIPPFYDEGSAGKIWPIGLGAQRNVRPTPLYAALRLYGLGDAPMSNIARVSDNAAPLDPNALPPQYTPALDGAGVTLQTDAVGRVAVDCSSVGQQYATPGAADVLNGDGKFFPWTGVPVNTFTTTPPPNWTWSNNAGSTLGKIARPSDPTVFAARIISARPWYPSTPDYEGDYLSSNGTPLLGGRSYRVTFELPNVYSAPPLGNPYGPYFGGIAGGIMLRSALGNNPADAITPHGVPIRTALPYGQTYSFEFTVPAGPARKLYLMGVASSGATAGSANGTGGGEICRLNLELLGQYAEIPLQGITLRDAFTEILVNRCGEDPGVFNAADCDAIDAATGYTIGLRYEDQPNVLDMLTTVADQWGAVIFTDALGQIRVRRLTNNDDGPIVAAFSRANIDPSTFTSLPDSAPGLTTNFGGPRNWEPFGDNDFVTDPITVTPSLRAQFMGTSQFNVTATTPLAAEYAAANGAGRMHMLLATKPMIQIEGNRVCGLHTEKHVFRQFVARYDNLSIGIGPSIAPQNLFYNDKITVDLPDEFGWHQERMTVVGTEPFPGDNRILITVRH